MSNVLLISYLFPPAGGIGVPRAVSYTKYLPAHGCEVSVLTARWPATPVKDPNLGRQVPVGTAIYRAFNPEVPYALRDSIWKQISQPRIAPELEDASRQSIRSRGFTGRLSKAARRAVEYVACPDPQRVWVPFAIRLADQVIRKRGIDTLLISIPPYSSMSIGVELKRRFPGVKLISDIRDDWRGFYLPYYDNAATPRKQRIAERLERELIESSDYVSAITAAQMENIRSRYPQQATSKFVCVPNGYNPDLYANLSREPAASRKMVLTYFGSVYLNPCYSPALLLDALDSLPDSIRENVEIRFVGRVAREAQSLLANRRVTIHQIGFLPQGEAVRYLQDTDYLVLISRDRTGHCGKLFDYLAAGRAILALTPPDGEAASVIRETGTGWCIEPESVTAIRLALIEAYERFREGNRSIRPDPKAIEAYAWPNLVGRMVEATGMGHCAESRLSNLSLC